MPDLVAKRYKALCKVLRYREPLQVVDVGANPMNFDPPYKELHDHGAIIVTGFDPQKETLAKLDAGKNSQDRFLPYAIGDGQQHELNIYKGSGLTSLLNIRRPTLFFLMGLKRAARLLGNEKIETIRLDDIQEIKSIDLLKIDIQGAEPLVFKNSYQKLGSAVAIHTEVSFFPLYQDQPSFGEVDMILRKQGFVPHSFYHTVKRTVRSSRMRELQGFPPSQLLDGDMIYFRDLSQPDKLTNDQLRKLAIISDGIYGFFDYALRCIDELERRDEIDIEAVPAYLGCLNK